MNCISPSYVRYAIYQYFLPFCRLSFYFVDSSFCCVEAFEVLPLLYLAFVNNAAMNVGVQRSLQDSAFKSIGYILRSGIAGSYGNSIFIFLRNCHTILYSSFTILHSHQQCTRVLFSLPLPTLFFLFIYSSPPNVCKMVSHCSFDVRFPNDVEHLFMCLFAICMSICAFCPFSDWVVYIFTIEF